MQRCNDIEMDNDAQDAQLLKLPTPPECRHHEQSEHPVHRRWDQGLRAQSPGPERANGYVRYVEIRGDT